MRQVTTSVALGPLVAADVRPMARLHRAAFPGFFLSELGEPFLVQLYRGFLADASTVSVVAREPEGALLGAAVGTIAPERFFRRLLRSRWPGFVLASARAAAVSPAVAPRLVRALRYRGGTSTGSTGGALLSSICVDPAARGRGVGRQLIDAWCQQVADRGVGRAYLATDADHNDAVNYFYQANGWILHESYCTREGRAMSCYMKTLEVL